VPTSEPFDFIRVDNIEAVGSAPPDSPDESWDADSMCNAQIAIRIIIYSLLSIFLDCRVALGKPGRLYLSN